MRIGLLGPFPPFRGGIAQFGARLADTLSGMGHSVDRIGFRTLYPGVFFPGKTQFEDSGSHHPPVPRLLHPTLFPSWPGARRRMSQMKWDLALVQWWHPFFAPCFFCTLPGGVPATAICHNLLPHEGFPLSRALARLFLRRTEAVAVHSGADAERAEALGIRAVQLFHPLYDQYLPGAPSMEEARRKLGIGSDRVVLLFFGLVRRYKGLDTLVKAMKILPDDHVLLAVGENYGSEEKLLALASSLGNRFIRVSEFVPDSRVGLYFNASDVLVLPYRSGTQSGVAQIGLAFGKPVVTTSAGGLGEAVVPGSTGEIVREGSPESLAEGIERCVALLPDAGLPGRIASHAERFSWKAYAERLLEGVQ